MGDFTALCPKALELASRTVLMSEARPEAVAAPFRTQAREADESDVEALRHPGAFISTRTAAEAAATAPAMPRELAAGRQRRSAPPVWRPKGLAFPRPPSKTFTFPLPLPSL